MKKPTDSLQNAWVISFYKKKRCKLQVELSLNMQEKKNMIRLVIASLNSNLHPNL